MGDQGIFGEMEHLMSPFCYSAETALPEIDRTLIPRTKYLQGFISEDCKWGCFFNNASIQCFSVDTKISDYHYLPRSHVNLSIPASPYSFPPRCVITCGCELGLYKYRSWTGGLNRVLVGLDCSGVAPHYNQGGGEGAVAIYDQVQQQVVKWIPLPEPVSNVKVLSHFEAGDSIKPFFNGAMMAMVGIAAIGMKGGKVIILDLGLDKTEYIPATGHVTFASVAAPKQSIPFTVVDVDPFERLIATNRHNAIRQNNLISLSVGDPANSDSEEDTFIYAHSTGVEIARFEKSQVDVTALEYIPNIGCLLVGFSFGGFQMWRVDDLSLQYSSSLPEYDASVLSFGFQQPIDDPKNFCYIWVLYGAQTYKMSQSKLDLYQLFFEEKSHIENFGCIYQNLQKCAKSLSITLEDVFLPRDESIEDEQDSLERYLVHPLRLWIKNELVFISWKVSRSELFYVGIFDLNQWYSSYTSARVPTAELGPFWVTIPVERHNSEGSIPWDFRMVPASLQRWENQYKQVDIHFYPSSITFQGVCLTTRGYYSFEHFGIQEKIIRIILRDGHTLMAEPALLRQYCRTYGLQPLTTRIYEPELFSDKDIDRFYIFTALLESKRPSVIVKMANMWLDGSFSNVGCTIDLIIYWIRDLSLTVRYIAEQHWDNVFNLSAENMLPESKNFLGYSNFIWNSLHSLLSILIRHDEVYNVSRMTTLDGLKFSLEKLVQYSAAMLMFFQADILPTNEMIIESMVEYHSQRRLIVKEALANCDVIPTEVKERYPYLVIDQMITSLGEDVVRKEWNLESTDDLYPPRHAGYVNNMIMWRNIDFKLISRVVFYFILDFMFTAGLPSSKLRGDFSSVIRLNAEEQEEVYNIWNVDHGYFDEPLAYLAQNPRFNGRDESAAAWATALTIITGFKSSEAVTGLLSLGCPPYLGKLYINVLGQDKLLYKKLLNDVCKTSVMLEPEILHHFFRVAMERNFLLEFINEKLHEAPEPIPTELLSFLEKQSSFDYSSLLLAFHAKLYNVDKANQLFKVMRDIWGSERGLNPKQREVWSRLKVTMSSWEMVKRENIVMDFLNMKRQSDAAPPPVPVITIKPRRIVNLVASSSSTNSHGTKSADYSEMSPLRKYVPKTATGFHSPDNFNGSNGKNAEIQSKPTSFDVESILKTPAVDHRKSRWRDNREGSVDNSRYGTPPPGEDMHSILKKSDGSSRSRSSLKTRFLDPSSGEEMKSPECMSCEDAFNIGAVYTQSASGQSAASNIAIPPQRRDRVSSPSYMDGEMPERETPSPTPNKPDLIVRLDFDDMNSEDTKAKVSRSVMVTRSKVHISREIITTEYTLAEDALNLGEKLEEGSSADTATADVSNSFEPKPRNISSPSPMEARVPEIHGSEISNSDIGVNLHFEDEKEPPVETSHMREVSASTSESNDESFVDADGQSLEMSVETSQVEPAEARLEAKEEVEPVSPITTPPKSENQEEPVFLSPDSVISVTEFERNLQCGDEINLSSASTEVDSVESHTDEKVSPPEPQLSVVPPAHEEFIHETKDNSSPIITDFPEPKSVAEVTHPSKMFESPNIISAPKSEFGQESSEEVDVMPETPANVTSKANATFENTRIDESLFTTSFTDLPLLGKPKELQIESPAKSETSSDAVSFDISSIHNESVFSTTDQSLLDTTTDNVLELGPRRLTRGQRALLEKGVGHGTISQMGEANLTPPKHSPVKEKSPARSAGRSRRGKSEGPSSVVSSEDVVKVRRRVSRRSETPESDISETSARRVTRSQLKKIDSSLSGSQSSLDSQPLERTTRARSRAKTPSILEPVFEEGASRESLAETPKKRGSSSRRKSIGGSSSGSSRAKSEPPASATPLAVTPKKRGRKVANYAPDLSTVMEISDTSLATTPRQERYKRRRPSEIESVAEEGEESEGESEKSILETSTTSAKRTRRSVTPMSQLSSDTSVSTPRRRRRSSSTK